MSRGVRAVWHARRIKRARSSSCLPQARRARAQLPSCPPVYERIVTLQERAQAQEATRELARQIDEALAYVTSARRELVVVSTSGGELRVAFDALSQNIVERLRELNVRLERYARLRR